MMKKFICIFIIFSLVTVITACGQGSTPAPVAEQSSMDAEVTSVTEEASSEAVATKEPTEELEATVASPDEGESVSEEATEDTANDEAIWTGELTEEYAMAKLKRISDAYDQLVNENGYKDAEKASTICIYPINKIEDIPIIDDLSTKDGASLSDPLYMNPVGKSMIYYYYDNYVNNNGDYFDFADYIKSNNYEEIIKPFNTIRKIGESDENYIYDSNYTAFNNVVWIPALCNGEMSIENISDKITINSKPILNSLTGELIDPAYQFNVLLDRKDTGIVALFDKDGNFINFNDENAKIDLVNPIELSEVR